MLWMYSANQSRFDVHLDGESLAKTDPGFRLHPQVIIERKYLNRVFGHAILVFPVEVAVTSVGPREIYNRMFGWETAVPVCATA
jgi:hypothetical protein